MIPPPEDACRNKLSRKSRAKARARGQGKKKQKAREWLRQHQQLLMGPLAGRHEDRLPTGK
jgi:hypothetical protein